MAAKKAAKKKTTRKKAKKKTTTRKPAPKRDKSMYEDRTAHDRMRNFRARANDLERVIGDMPKCKDQKRKESCRFDLVAYLETYHGETYNRDFSPSHVAMLQRLQHAILGQSGWLVETAFRGFGKTSLTEGAAMWAINYGHRKYMPVIGPDEDHASKLMDSIKVEYECNDILCEDFPEICWPIRALEGKFQRCRTQTFRDKMTYVEWGGKTAVFPTIPGSEAAGSIIQAKGYQARLRGLRHKKSSGEVVRPDFVILEDPQTEKTANSPSLVDKLLDVLVNAILGMAGHDKRISVVIPSTIIKKGDAIDIIATDKERFGAWVHNNTPMMIEMPHDMDAWLVDYADARRNFDPTVAGDQERAHQAANEIYKANREKMDAGAVAAWDECFDNTEISAIQHGMNILIDRGEAYFASECQGTPIDQRESSLLELSEEVVARRTNGLQRHYVPASCYTTTAFIDVGFNRLHWMVASWDAQFSGHIAAYGEFPGDGSDLYDKRMMGPTQGVAEGVKRCIDRMLSLVIHKDDGDQIPIDRVMIDCGEPSTRGEIFAICRGHRFSCPVMPSRGRAHHKFRMPSDKKKRGFLNAYLDVWKSYGRLIIHDACVWRERVQRNIMASDGTPGAIRIWGDVAERHTALSRQICAETLVEKLVGETGEVYKWMLQPGAQNHLLDCLVGCAVCASVEGLRPQGASRPDQENRPKRRRRRGGFRAIG